METTTILSEESKDSINQLEGFETIFYEKVLELFKIFEACRKTGILRDKRADPSLTRCFSNNMFCHDIWHIGSYIIEYGFNDNWKHPWCLNIHTIKRVYGKWFIFKRISKITIKPLLSAVCQPKDRERIQKGIYVERSTPFYNININDFYSFIMTLKIEIEELIKLRNIESSNKMDKLGDALDVIKQIEGNLSTVV